jgi:ArsR family transcriptional regulator, zinc-responsive transcriptional repressor
VTINTPETRDPLAAASELLRALSAPHRLAIVVELATGPRCVHELTASLGASQSLTSQHLRVLRTSGLVRGVRRGKEMTYSLADEHVARIAHDALAHGSEPQSSAVFDQANAGSHEPRPVASTTNTRGAPG